MTKVLASPIVPFLPLLYVAWADGVLSPSEIELLKQEFSKADLPDEIQSLLNKWLDPKNPPSATQLNHWKKYIVENIGNLDEENKKSLFNIGYHLATLQEGGEWLNESTKKSLLVIESNLGIICSEAIRDLLLDTKSQEESKKEETKLDSKQVSLILEGEHFNLKQRIRELFKDEKFDTDNRSHQLKEYREEVYIWTKLLADQGFGTLAFSKEYGGTGNLKVYGAMFEEIAKYDISLLIKFGVHFGLFGGSIYWLGTEKHHKKYLNKIGNLEMPGCFAMTEMHHGSNVRELQTTATFNLDNNSFVINTPTQNDRKTYIGNAAQHAKFASVFAQLVTLGESYGVHAFLVQIRDDNMNPMPGITIGDNGIKMGLNGVDNGTLHFNKVEIPAENLLNRFGNVDEKGNYTSPITSSSRRFFTMLGTLVGGRLCVPMAGLSAAKKALAIAIQFSDSRTQFGPPDKPAQSILDYQTHQKRLMPLLANAYAYHFAHQYMMERFDDRTEEEGQEIEALAAGLKAMSTWNTTATIQECREACGGKGYLNEMYFADLKADTDIFTTFEGDNTVLLQLTGKSRLTYFKQAFGKMSMWDTVKYVTEIASTNIAELNPIVTRNTSEAHLLSNEFQLAAFKYRETHSLRTVAMRLNKRIKSGMDSYQAFLETQVHLLEMAKAYIDYVVMEQFILKVNSIEDASIKQSLSNLKNLFAFNNLEQNKGWFLENEYLAPAKSKAISKLIKKLIKQVKVDSIELTNAFNIPSHMINNALAFG